jgi:hypothetical protein
LPQTDSNELAQQSIEIVEREAQIEIPPKQS